MARSVYLLALATAALVATRAAAQAAGDAYLVVSPEPARAPQFAALARAWADARPGGALDLAAAPDPPPSASVSRAQLALLGEIERALLEARELSDSLREAAALRVLEAAESKLLDALELPGAHAYLSELNVQLGLCAAQLGETGLAETALARAFSLDRTRRVEAAETPPTTLALAARIARNQAARPSSEAPLRVTPAAALVWLDGAPLGAGASSLRAPAGVHLLAVRAAGHAPYAALVRLEPGQRPVLSVALSPLPAEQARRALLASRADGWRTPAAALARARGGDVYLLEGARGPLPRALVHRCGGAGCGLLEGISAGSAARAHFRASTDAHAWLDATASAQGKPDAVPVWRRWPLWASAAVIAASGVTAAFLVTRDRPTRHEREVVVDPGTPPP